MTNLLLIFLSSWLVIRSQNNIIYIGVYIIINFCWLLGHALSSAHPAGILYYNNYYIF